MSQTSMKILTWVQRNFFVITLLSIAAWSATTAQDAGWPRERTVSDGTRIKIYQPQIDSWDQYQELEFHLAAEFTPPGAGAPILAAMRVEAACTTDFATRTVVVYNAKLVEARFPAADEAVAQRLTRLATELMPAAPLELSLERLLAYFEPGAEQPETGRSETREVQQRPDPPVILVSQSPALLVLFDGEPVFAPIEGTDLFFAVNTNWDFLRQGDSMYYLLYGDAWLRAEAVSGPWMPAGKLPTSFGNIPKEDNWAEIHKNLPGKTIPAGEFPKVHVSEEPAELIVLEGQPRFETIESTGISWVTNTDVDLFRTDKDGAYFYLVSGRWFRAKSLAGPWSFATDRLPAGFAGIPADHSRGRVRVSVPGTPEAEEAVMLAQVPRKVEVKRSEVTVSVAYAGDPQFEPIEGTTMAYAVNTSFDVIRVEGVYYTCHQAVWFEAGTPDGPWFVADSVPEVIYTIPPSSPKYHVTYVEVYDSTPDTVVVGYTSGYSGIFIVAGCVVFGTGHYHPPYYHYPPYGYPVYYGYPHSYGAAAWYNPHTGTYGRGAAVYGPYGGYGMGSSYNPHTGAYTRGVAAYGPYQAGYARRGYNPRTDTYAATYQRSNPYQSWGESVVSRGDDWIHSGHYSDSRGTVGAIETSRGGEAVAYRGEQGSGFVGRDEDNNVYAGRDGNVYKHEDGSWSKHGKDGWSEVDPPDKAAVQQQAAERGIDTDATAQRAQDARTGHEAGTQRYGESDAAARSQRASAGSSSRGTGEYQHLQQDRQARARGSERSQNYGSANRGRSGGGGGRRR